MTLSREKLLNSYLLLSGMAARGPMFRAMVRPLLGVSRSHIQRLGLHPSSGSGSGFLPAPTMGDSSNGSRTWISATHVEDLDLVLGP